MKIGAMGLLIKLLGTLPSVPPNSLNIKSKILSALQCGLRLSAAANGGQLSRIRLQVKKVGSVRIRGSTDQWLRFMRFVIKYHQPPASPGVQSWSD